METAEAANSIQGRVQNRTFLFTAGSVASSVFAVACVFLSPKGILQSPLLQVCSTVVISALYGFVFVPALKKRSSLSSMEFEKRLMIVHAPLYASVLHNVIDAAQLNQSLHILLLVAIAGTFLYLFMRWFFQFDFLIVSFLMLAVFCFSFVFRLPHVSLNLQTDSLELSMYLTGGKLMALGVNPYDYNDNVPVREKLRFSRYFYNSYWSATPERWNYYVSGNLPLSLIFYRTMYLVSPHDTATAFRMAIALLDSLLSAFVVLFCILFWRDFSPTAGLFLGLMLAAVSPILLYDGIVNIDDKGPQILLMVLALLCSRFAKSRLLFLLGALFLGMSISFKALGIFLIPLCVLHVFYSTSSPSKVFSIRNILISRKVYLYLAVTSAFTFACFIPFLPEIFSMMFNRVSSGAGMEIPIHGSMWRYVEHIFGDHWQVMKSVYAAFLVGIAFYGLWKGRITLEVLIAVLLLDFVAVVLVGGSMDRQNIALTIAILLIGSFSGKEARFLTFILFGGGLLAYLIIPSPAVFRYFRIDFDPEYLQSLLMLGFMMCFTYRIASLVFVGRSR